MKNPIKKITMGVQECGSKNSMVKNSDLTRVRNYIKKLELSS